MNPLVLQELGREESFDPLTLSPSAPLTQAQFYGDWQESLGREVRRFVILDGTEVVAYFQLIKYHLFGKKSYYYIPYGPVVKEFSKPLLALLRTELSLLAKKNNIIFTRLDFTPAGQSDKEKKLLRGFFTKSALATYSSPYFQPRSEWFLKLDKTEEELLKEMHKGTRYSIHLAGRKGVTTEIVTEDFGKYFETFYELMAVTAKRNGFNLHSKNYYQNIFKNLRSDNAYLGLAKYGEKVLVIKLVIRYGEVASCIFSGSSDDHRELRPTYLVQWDIIKQAKNMGHAYYSFGGISSGGSHRSWAGLTVFKKNFGGEEIKHSEFFDLVAQPLWYGLYNLRKMLKNHS